MLLQAVNEQNAARLPLMLATKLLPAMEAEEAQMLAAHRAAAHSKDLGTQIAELTVRQADAQAALCAAQQRHRSGLHSCPLLGPWPS